MNDNFKFFDAEEYTSNLKCTIQKTGKIGFSEFTQKMLGIKEGMSIRIGVDGIKDNYKSLLIKLLDTIEKNAFKVNKAGNYYYINPKPLLDELDIKYKEKSLMYDMVIADEKERIYKLVKREGKVSKS